MKHKINELFKNDLPITNGKKLIIFGTGNTSLLYINSFVRENLNIYAFCDNNINKIGKEFFNKKIISFDELKNIKNAYVLICSQNVENSLAIKKHLDDNNIINDYMDYYIFLKHKKEVLKVVDLLSDNESKETYLDIVYSRMTNTIIEDKLFSKNQYFAYREFYVPNEKQVFLDLGAYVGDTLEEYINTHYGIFDRIYAFEPGEKCYKALENRVERLEKEWVIGKSQIKLINNPIGKEQKNVKQINSSTNHLVGTIMIDSDENSENCSLTINLCEYFKNQHVSFIKADIESYEYDMILGAEGLIKKDKPIMAISIYHNSCDMFEIPLLIYKYNNKYTFRLKHHSYNYDDTILYVN